MKLPTLSPVDSHTADTPIQLVRLRRGGRRRRGTTAEWFAWMGVSRGCGCFIKLPESDAWKEPYLAKPIFWTVRIFCWWFNRQLTSPDRERGGERKNLDMFTLRVGERTIKTLWRVVRNFLDPVPSVESSSVELLACCRGWIVFLAEL